MEREPAPGNPAGSSAEDLPTPIRVRRLAGPVAAADLDALYDISLRTGLAGGDASDLYRDGRLIGQIYSLPYAVLTPDRCILAEDAEGVCGYITGAFDTAAFEDRLEREWWPALRARYPDPSDRPRSE